MTGAFSRNVGKVIFQITSLFMQQPTEKPLKEEVEVDRMILDMPSSFNTNYPSKIGRVLLKQGVLIFWGTEVPEPSSQVNTKAPGLPHI